MTTRSAASAPSSTGGRRQAGAAVTFAAGTGAAFQVAVAQSYGRVPSVP